MRARARRILGAAVGVTLGGSTIAWAEAVDFSTFLPAQGIPTNFVDPQWSTPDSYNGIAVPAGSIARETTNADTTMFYGPPSLDLTNKIISGDLYAGNDDDYLGIALGVPADSNPMLDGAADFLLLQWKGLSQGFDYNDRLAPGEEGYSPFHNSTVGGAAPTGLSLSRVRGLPTADEYWQRADLTMYDPQGKTAPDPLVDPILGGTPDADSGGLTELGRGAFFGDKTYGPRHHLEIHYTPENVKVFVDGALELDVNAAPGALFPSGTLGLYEQAHDPSGAFAFFDVRNIGDPAPPPAPSLLATVPFTAANITVPEDNTNAGSTWTVVEGTAGPGAITVLSPPNVADVDFGIGGSDILPNTGVLFATVRQNGPRGNGIPDDVRYGGAEAPFDSGFGGPARAGVATFGFQRGGEWNVDVAVGFFPYERFSGGYVTPQGAIRHADDVGPNTPYTITQKSVPLPSIVKYANNLDGTLPTGGGQPFFAGNQQFVTNVAIRDKDANTGPGILFTIGASNEDNYTGAAILPDGTWNVAVRDNDSHFYGGPDTFERDNFAFLYLEPGDMPGSAGGRVTGLDGGGAPAFAQSWGDYTLTRADTGVYQLSLDGGESYVINILGHRLTGDFTFTDTDTDGDGTPDTRTFNDTQDLVPELVDSPFSFAFIPFEEGSATGPGMLLLTPNGTITLSDGTVAPSNYWMSYQLGTVPLPVQWAVDAGGNWSGAANWGGAVPNGVDAVGLLGGIITADRQVALDVPVTLGTLRFEGAHRYDVAGPSTLTMDVSTGAARISADGPASHVVSAPLVLADDTTVHVTQAAATLTLADLAETAARVTKSGAGTLAVNRVRAAALNVDAGTVRILSGGGQEGVSVLGALALAGADDAWTGTLDLADNDLILRADAATKDQVLARVSNQVKSARDGGSDGRWSGTGITSSTAAGDDVTGLAVVVNPGLETYAGQAVGPDDVIVKYTYNGDANLDGRINADDYFRIDNGFLEQPQNPTYLDGDFNYDGTVNADDYFLIDSAFLGQGAPIVSGASAAAIASVPEPGSTGGLLALLALGMSRTVAARTRRRSSHVPPGGSAR